MKPVLTPEQEAERLRALFKRFADHENPFLRVKSQAAFARKHEIPGGPSMVSQHLSGHRPISLDAALAYARGFGVALEEISPRLAADVQRAADATSGTAPSSSLQAQSVSYPDATLPYNEPPTLEWRELKLGKIVDRFRTQMPDASMDAGRSPIPKGRWLVFDKAAAAPDGRRAIVRVNGDLAQIYVRRVKEVDGGWLAKPDDPDFDSFDSRKVQLDVIALLHHIEMPDED